MNIYVAVFILRSPYLWGELGEALRGAFVKLTPLQSAPLPPSGTSPRKQGEGKLDNSHSVAEIN
ncbi:hypothetical protein A4G18_03585 [Pasteurellaceae bacterium Pebbles2]|nr:hypothetical protein [Pasteurellaceae bacterium Pebbles2]